MSIVEVPKAYIYTCDACGKEHRQENAAGHYTDSRPSNWHRLKWSATAYDYQGTACADDSFERLLCDGCGYIVKKSINSALAAVALAALTK